MFTCLKHLKSPNLVIFKEMLISLGMLLLFFHDQLGMIIFYFSIAHGLNIKQFRKKPICYRFHYLKNTPWY
jgi:hypothetical protein